MHKNSLVFMMKTELIRLLTKQYNQMICISSEIQAIVKKSGIQNGLITIQTMHTTTGIMMNEQLECLESDIQCFFDELVPEEKAYAHARMLDDYGSTAGNPTGHLKSILCGNHCHLFLVDGEIVKGGAQEVYFVEFDGPAQRKVLVMIAEL